MTHEGLVDAENLRAKGIRSVAILEATKGLLVLIAGFGLLSLVHHDLQAVAEHLVRRSHLNPARHYPRIFIEAATHTSSARLKSLAFLAFAYSTIRFIEAYGLWRIRTWAEWFAIISGSIYLPIELFEFFKKPTILRGAVFFINLIIVLYLGYIRFVAIRERKKEKTVPIAEPVNE
jgi:uncharacterized membrane protein (DUF2068 family)